MAESRKSKIYFFFEEQVSLQDRTRLKAFLAGLFKKEERALVSLNYVFTSDGRLLEINRRYLKHDYYTDIITFEMAEVGSPSCGEIYISIPRVRENASLNGDSVRRELHRVIFHGALHLCGYDDKSESQKKRMRKREDFYLDQYFS